MYNMHNFTITIFINTDLIIFIAMIKKAQFVDCPGVTAKNELLGKYVCARNDNERKVWRKLTILLQIIHERKA